MKLSHVLLGLVIIGLIILILRLEKCSGKSATEQEQTNLIEALNDTLRNYKYKDSLSAATISVLRTESIESFLKLKTNDQEIKNLQGSVLEHKDKLKAGSSITNSLIETLAKTTNPTVITKTDTVKVDNIIYVYPEYTDTIDNKWLTYYGRMNRDSSYTQIRVNNEFTAMIGVDKKKPFVDIVLENPYSTVKTLRTYQVSLPKPKKFGIGPNASYGISDGFRPRVYVGIGVQYNFIRF